jgi:hypothetical protein
MSSASGVVQAETEIARPLPLAWAVLIAGILLSLPYVYAVAFTGVSWHDDEGTLMITFRDLLEGKVLYNEAYALYGPFYYISVGRLFFDFGIPLTHDNVRLISSAFWLLCTASLTILIYKITRSLAASGFTFVISLFLFGVFVQSPLHPQEICLFLLILLPHFLHGLEGRSSIAPLIAIGAVIVALTLTKLNIGVFAGAAVVLVALRMTEQRPWLRLAHIVIVLGCLALPVALMAPLMRFPWVATYCAFAVVSLAPALLVWSRIKVPASLTLWHWAGTLAAAAAAALVFVAAVVVGGTSLHAVLNAVVLQNMQFIQNWYIATNISPLSIASAGISLLIAIVYVFADARPATRETARRGLLWLKLAISATAIAFVSYMALTWVPIKSVPGVLFQYLLPFCWLVLVPPQAPGRQSTLAVRGGIGLLSAFMIMYAFPVGGGQVIISCILPAATLSVLLHDAVVGLPLRLPPQLGLSRRHWQMSGSALAIVGLAGLIISQSRHSVNDYVAGVSLDLPGAKLIHVKPDTADTYHWAVRELSRCGSFYSMTPSQLSFYFWTGKPSPTAINNNNALGLLSWPQQERVVADLAAQPELCILTLPERTMVFDRGQMATNPPLLRYVEENFTVAAEHAPYRLLKRKTNRD